MNINNEYITLSAQRALLGLVTDNLRAFSVSYDQNCILKLYFYYQNTPSTKEQEQEGEITAEMAADLPGIKRVDTKSVTLPFPSKIPKEGIQIYLKEMLT